MLPTSGARLSEMKMKLKGMPGSFTAAASGTPPKVPVHGGGSSAAAATATTAQEPPVKPAPIGKRLKDVQDFLRANLGDTFSAAEILKETGHDLTKDDDLLERLHAAPLVAVEDLGGGSALRLRYQPKNAHVRDRASVLNFVRDHPLGVWRCEVDDCYKGVLEDLSALQAEGKLHSIPDPEMAQNGPALFPAEMLGVKVDEDIAEQYLGVECGRDVVELQTAVVRAGLRSALATQAVKRAGPGDAPRDRNGKRKRPRKERAVNLAKVTNAHLPALFSGSAPKNIDQR